jgi:hypothetical protein
MANIYVRLVSAAVLLVVVLGLVAPALVSASSTVAVVLGFALVIGVIPVTWIILRPILAKIFS